MERKDKKKRGIKRRGRGEGVEQGGEKDKKDKEEEGKEIRRMRRKMGEYEEHSSRP